MNVLGSHFHKEALRQVRCCLFRNKSLEWKNLNQLLRRLKVNRELISVTVQGNPITEDGKNAKFSVTFAGNPYGEKAFDTVLELRTESEAMLKEAGLTDTELFIAGETAKHADLRDINDRDTWLVMILMTVLITIMLGLQTRSIIAPLYMMGTILLSYAATLGLSYILFKTIFRT